MGTEYVVLQKDESGCWKPLGIGKAGSAEQAQRKFAEANQGGTFVAVPSRSWKPVSFTVENISRVKIIEGGES